jgi:hypothetical protein
LGEWRYSSTHSLTSTLDGGQGSASRPGCFTPRERAPFTHWIGGWVGTRVGLDAASKRKIPSTRLESKPDRPVRSQSLYRLSYPGSYWEYRDHSNLINNPMEQSYFEKLIVAQLDNKSPLPLLWDQKFHYRVHKNPSLDPILNLLKSIYIFLTCCLNIVRILGLQPPSYLFPSGVLTKIFYAFIPSTDVMHPAHHIHTYYREQRVV